MGDSDILRVMIATDNHLGYMEADPIRRNDSFEAFEEVFKLVSTRACGLSLGGARDGF